MSLSSMTGFARAAGTLPDGAPFVWELRSVNGRGLDVRLRLPAGLDALDQPLREAAGQVLKRGNVSATLAVKRETRAAARLTPDPEAIENALRLALDLAARIPGAPPPRAEALLTLPGVLRAEAPEADEASEEAARAAVIAGFGEALDGLAAMRREEGRRLAAILAALLDEIASLTEAAQAEAAAQPGAIRARIEASLAALLAGEGRIPEERLAAEVALLAGRADVREELDRLAALIRSGEPIGRRLEFLTQEFAREANTLGAKSASLGLTRLSLDLKAAVERLREQAANVE
jgi:uncharacterized protein (TIGR00255 family)